MEARLKPGKQYDCRVLRENSINTDEATLGKHIIIIITPWKYRNDVSCISHPIHDATLIDVFPKGPIKTRNLWLLV